MKSLRLISFAASLGLAVAAPVQKDTAALANHSKGLRAQPALTSSQHAQIRAEYLNWIDTRMKAGVSANAMNRELNAAGLVKEGPNEVNEFFENYTGYLGEVGIAPTSGGSDLLAVTAAVDTGMGCSANDFIALYSRDTVARVAVISAEPKFDRAWHLSGLAVGPGGPRGRLVGSGWFVSRCTSTITTATLRLDALGPSGMRTILNRQVSARSGLKDWDVKFQIGIDVATFRYAANMSDAQIMIRPGIEIYRVKNGHARRVAPIALTRGGFIDEWLNLDPADVPRWSSPEAAAAHQQAAVLFLGRAFEWDHVAKCSGSKWEIGIRTLTSKETRIFLMDAPNAAAMRMLKVSEERSPSCVPVDITGDLTSIAGELPQ